MEYRRLGRSGLKVSEISLGTLGFGFERGRSEQESVSIIAKALDLGINFLDTADVYDAGHSEEIVGKAVKGKRSEVIIATKFGIPTGDRPNDYGGSRYHVMAAIEASLKRLGTDYIDLYYMHWPDPTTPIEETLRALDDLVRAGKIRYIACSNFTGWQLCEAAWISRVNNLASFVAVQSQYNMLERGIESEVVPCCQLHGLSVVPWRPLAGGFLTGRYGRGKPAPAGTRVGSPSPGRTGSSSDVMTRARLYAGLPGSTPPLASLLSDANFDKLERWQKFAAERGHTMGELAIAWLLSHAWVSAIIAGVSSSEQVSANVAAAKWKLTAEEMARLG
jgi:aryl-alcohol dehydrogenase-like predicted oxidoreductase